METGFLNFHDEEHFSTLPLSLYQQSAMLEDDSSLLDMIPDQLDVNSPWDASELDRLGHHDKEDFHDMISNWHDQLGSMKFEESSFDEPEKKPLVGKDLSLARLVMEGEDETHGLLAVNNEEEVVVKEEDDFRIDVDDECIDVETVSANEQIPVLEAGDVTTLLEQFEATETFNSSAAKPRKHTTYLESRLFAMATEPVGASVSHQNIIDALPREVIERIKASGRKKAIPVIPAMPSRKMGRAGTRMQDAGAALNRNKLLKIVSSAPSTGESIQLDHDYCSAATSSSSSPDVVASRPFYHSDASEYCRSDERSKKPAPERIYSRLPDYYLVLKDTSVRRESDSRKDSGLESGDMSDASEESSTKCNAANSPGSGGVNCDRERADSSHDKIVTINGKTINLGTIMQNVNKALTNKDTPMVSVLKQNSMMEKVVTMRTEVAQERDMPKKRKLNIAEYRNRMCELGRSLTSCDSSRASSPTRFDDLMMADVDDKRQEFEQATQLLMEANGRLDEETCAKMMKTLEMQASMRMSANEIKNAIVKDVAKRNENEVEKDSGWKLIEVPVKSRDETRVPNYKSDGVSNNVSSVDIVFPIKRELKAVQNHLQIDISIKKEDSNDVTKCENVATVDTFAVNRPIVLKTEDAADTLPKVPTNPDQDMKIEYQVTWNSSLLSTDANSINDVQTTLKQEDSSILLDTKPETEPETISMDYTEEHLDAVDMEISDESFTETCEPAVGNPVSADSITSEDHGSQLIVEERETSQDDKHETNEAALEDCSIGIVEVESVTEKSEEGLLASARKLQDERGKTLHRSRRQFRSRRESSSSSSSNVSNSRPVKRSSPSPSRSHSRSSSSSYSSRSPSSSSYSKSSSWRSTSRQSYSRASPPRKYSRQARDRRQSYHSWSRSRSPVHRVQDYQLSEREKERQVEERRVIYVGRIGESMTKALLRSLFESYGTIVDISLHFREHADNYGFVTFAYKGDAYAAVEEGKKNPALDQYDLSFGGRRAFCKSRYSDLDVGNGDDDIYGYPQKPIARVRPQNTSMNFDDLLREALQKKKAKV